jgi:signal transduction histidine kinase
VYRGISLQGHVWRHVSLYGRGVPDPDPHFEDGAGDVPVLRRVFKRDYTARQLVLIDLAAVILLALFCLFVLPRDVPKVQGSGWRIAGGIAYSISALGVLVRRRRPLASLVVVEAIAFVAECLRAPGPTPFYTMMALYSVVAVSTRRKADLVVAFVAASVLASSLIAGGGGTRMVLATNGGLALVGVAWLAGAYTRANRAYERHLADRAAEEAATLEVEQAEQVRRAVADERVEIARELHDIVAHAMSVIAVRSGAARMVIDTQPEQAREALRIIETTTRRSLQEMRLLVGVLRGADEHRVELGPVPNMDDIDHLLADMAAAGVLVELRIDGEPRPLPAAAGLTAYRIVQEALTNVVRHAGPTTARLHISFGPDEVAIEVTDDGPQSFSPKDLSLGRHGSGHGLIGMRERALLFGGSLEAGSYGPGFRIRADLHVSDLDPGDLPVKGVP